MIAIQTRIYRPNGDYYTVWLVFSGRDLAEVGYRFKVFGAGYYAATKCIITFEHAQNFYSNTEEYFRIPEEVERLAQYLKSKGFGCVSSSSS